MHQPALAIPVLEIELHADGSLDNSLNIGTGIAGAVNSIDLYPDGRIFLAGNFTQYNGAGRNRVARIAGDGTLDTLFNPALFTAYPSISGANGAVFTSILQSDGRIIIGGTFDKYNNVFRRSIVRLEADGSIDPTFVVGLGKWLAARQAAKHTGASS